MSAHRPNEAWPADRVQRLRELFDKKWSAGQIAGEFGLTRNAVVGKLARLNLFRGARTNQYTRSTEPAPAAPPKRTVRPQRIARFQPNTPVAPIPPTEAPSDGQGISLFELTNTTCRWPKGSVGDADFCFCGEPRADLIAGKPYCPPHTREARRA